ncbi:ribonuclease P protein component [Actinoallomurus sp. NPDC052308]
MLPSGHRMRRREEFTSAVRRGDRAGRPNLVLHLQFRDDVDEPARIGFTVGRQVGVAVVRNKVRRRLRHIAREHLHRLAPGSLLVVRANAKAATARHEELAADLDAALDRLLRRQVKRRT